MASKAEEALRCFAALRPKLEAEHCRRPSRRSDSAASTAVRSSATVSAPSGAPPAKLRAEPAAALSANRELRAQLDVADGIMRRLHAKNKQLLQRLAAAEAEARAKTPTETRAVSGRREELPQRAPDPHGERLHAEMDAALRGDCSAAELRLLLERAQKKMRADALRHDVELLMLRNSLREARQEGGAGRM